LDRDDNERGLRRQEAIALALEAFGRRIYKSLPAKVVRVDASKRSVDCKVLVQRPFIDETDARQVESIPVIPSVPLALPPFFCPPISDGSLVFGGSILPATQGMLVWCDRSIDRWLSGNGQEVDPEVDHENALTDAWFMPGVFPYGAVPFALPQDCIAIGDTTGNDFVALAAKVKAWFDAFNAAVTGWTPVANDGGAALKTALGTLVGGTPTTNVAATQVKAK
jgi:hypothetical protein